MSSSMTFNAYKALGLSDDASQRDIKLAYRRLALAHHPDKNQEKPDATAKFQQIVAAYDALKSPELQASYDARSTYSSPRSASSSPSSHRWWSPEPDSDSSFDFGSDDGFPFTFFFYGHSFTFGAGPQQQAKTDKESETQHQYRKYEDRRQAAENIRQSRAAMARARAEAEEVAIKATAMFAKMKKDNEENLIEQQKAEKMNKERATQEKIWAKIEAKTPEEKQANCLHTEFWPKQQQKRKFKCMGCGQKRGMTSFKCPYCCLMVCQLCIKKKAA